MFNDASSLTMFEIFKELVVSGQNQSVGTSIAQVARSTIIALLGGLGVGTLVGMIHR